MLFLSKSNFIHNNDKWIPEITLQHKIYNYLSVFTDRMDHNPTTFAFLLPSLSSSLLYCFNHLTIVVSPFCYFEEQQKFQAWHFAREHWSTDTKSITETTEKITMTKGKNNCLHIYTHRHLLQPCRAVLLKRFAVMWMPWIPINWN